MQESSVTPQTHMLEEDGHRLLNHLRPSVWMSQHGTFPLFRNKHVPKEISHTGGGVRRVTQLNTHRLLTLSFLEAVYKTLSTFHLSPAVVTLPWKAHVVLSKQPALRSSC